MATELTLKQRVFADQYVATKGNGTQAAIIAGYAIPSAGVTAHDNIRNPKVRARIKQLARKYEISADRVLSRLDNLSADAHKAKQYSAAISAEHLIGKALGMFIERRESINVDMTAEHLSALVEAAERRRQQG